MSACVPFTLGNPSPRWSNSSPASLLPISIAGLFWSSACVSVGPPLSARGASRGSAVIVSGGKGRSEEPETRLLAPVSEALLNDGLLNAAQGTPSQVVWKTIVLSTKVGAGPVRYTPPPLN